MPEVSAFALIGPVIACMVLAASGFRLLRVNWRLVEAHDAQRLKLDELRQRLRTVSERTGDPLLPSALMDNECVAVVIRRDPNEDDLVDIERPLFWINPETNRSWRATAEPGRWIENTRVNTHGVVHVTATPPSGVVFSVTGFLDPGAHDSILAIADPATSTQTVAEHIRALHPATCAAMDAMADNPSPSWLDICRNTFRESPPPTARRAEPVPVPRNPLHISGDPRRAIDLGDDPLDNESPPV